MSEVITRDRRGGSPLAQMGPARVIVAIAAVSFAGAQVLHEAGHCLVALLFGRGPTWGPSSLVQLSGGSPRDPAGWSQLVNSNGEISWLRIASLPSSDVEWTLFHAGGPVLQLIAIAVGLLLARRGAGRLATLGWLLAFVNGAGMVIYYGLGMLRGGLSDERNLAEVVGVEPLLVAAAFAIPALVGLSLALSWLPGRRERIRIGALGAAVIVLEGPLIFLANTAVRDQVDAGNGLFGPLLGFSAPVLVAAVAAVAVAAWAVESVQRASRTGRSTTAVG